MITIGKYGFEGPWLLSGTDFINHAAVYVILCRHSDANYEAVYIGETGQLGTRLSNHERAACWKRSCNGSLYVAVLSTPSDRYTADNRRAIEKELRDKYDPPCNRQ